MKRLDVAVVLVLISLFFVLLVYNTKFGANLNVIWIQSPELDVAGPQELEYKLLDWNKIVPSRMPSKYSKNVINSEKLLLGGLTEYQNIDNLKYEKDENVNNDGVKTNTLEDDKSESFGNKLSDIQEKPENGIFDLVGKHVATFMGENGNKQCDVNIPKVEERFDCHPENFPTQKVCEARGCCWAPTSARKKPIHTGSPKDPQAPVDVPYCYYPKGFPEYTVLAKEKTDTGFRVQMERNSSSYYPSDIKKLVMDVSYDTDSRLHFKIYDPNNKRYEVPLPLNGDPTSKAADPRYRVIVSEPGESFSVTVMRTVQPAGPPVFTTVGAAPLIFTDQFLQISSILPSKYIYGIGEHRDSLLHSVNWNRFTMWNRDHPPQEDTNSYGSHPFHVVIEQQQRQSGVFLLNSNGMDVILQPAPAITWRTIGGVLDFYIFLDDVVPQYAKLIGTSFMPPYWSLGFHQCRFGYKTVNATVAVVDRIRKYGIPQDVQWNDIDYAIDMKDFTTDLKRFGNQAAMVDEFHRRGLHYIIITDPGISSNQTAGTYPPFDMGVKMDIFIKNETGQLLVGKVWTGPKVWPDFTHPSTQEYWTTQIKTFHDKVKFDGLWLDMNEVSDFVDGSLDGCPHTKYDYPPYTPAVYGGHLYSFTMCPSGRQYQWRSYDLHNIYGLKEVEATYHALKEARGKRPFIISRSSFPSEGHYGGHWTGDNYATWHDLYRSISGILHISLSGISMVGPDICGFNWETEYELCLRWYQLGAFYPFSRSHNSDDVKKDQDPAAFDARFAGIVRKAFLTRYSLLPYLYYLFWWSHYAGDPVARPLWYGSNIGDEETYSVDRQFLWGDALLITPVLTQNATSVSGYFPAYSLWYIFYTGELVSVSMSEKGTKIHHRNATSVSGYFPAYSVWYDFYTGEPVSVSMSGKGNYIKLEAPLDHINLHVRGGYIIPMQDPALTTTESRKNYFSLLVAVGLGGTARGQIYWDDGDTIGSFENGAYNHIEVVLDNNILFATVSKKGYDTPMVLRNVTFCGFKDKPASVFLNKDVQKFDYDESLKVLRLPELNPKPSLTDGFMLQWMF